MLLCPNLAHTCPVEPGGGASPVCLFLIHLASLPAQSSCFCPRHRHRVQVGCRWRSSTFKNRRYSGLICAVGSMSSCLWVLVHDTCFPPALPVEGVARAEEGRGVATRVGLHLSAPDSTHLLIQGFYPVLDPPGPAPLPSGRHTEPGTEATPPSSAPIQPGRLVAAGSCFLLRFLRDLPAL